LPAPDGPSKVQPGQKLGDPPEIRSLDILAAAGEGHLPDAPPPRKAWSSSPLRSHSPIGRLRFSNSTVWPRELRPTPFFVTFPPFPWPRLLCVICGSWKFVDAWRSGVTCAGPSAAGTKRARAECPHGSRLFRWWRQHRAGGKGG